MQQIGCVSISGFLRWNNGQNNWPFSTLGQENHKNYLRHASTYPHLAESQQLLWLTIIRLNNGLYWTNMIPCEHSTNSS